MSIIMLDMHATYHDAAYKRLPLYHLRPTCQNDRYACECMRCMSAFK